MRKSKIATEKLIEYFLLGATARTAAELAGVNRNTSTYYFQRLRELIFQYQEETTMFSGEIEVAESYFGGVRISDTKTSTLLPIIKNKTVPDSIVYTDAYHSCDVLDVSEFRMLVRPLGLG